MPAGQGKDAEQLDAAIEQGTPPGSVADSELARDLEIVAMLRSRRAAYDPHPVARSDAKQRLMAALLAAQAEDRAASAAPVPHPAELTAPLPSVAGSPAPVAGATDETAVFGRVTDHDVDGDTGLEAEPLSVEAPVVRSARPGRHSMPTRPGSRGRSRAADRPPARGLRRRFAFVGAVAMVALVAITTAGNFASRNALPGDALYGVKRASEDTGLAFTFDDTERAQQYLALATTRLDEVEQLVRLGAGATSADPALVENAMRDFDLSTGEGSRMLLGAEDAAGAPALGDLRTWAAEQAARLSVLRSSLPETAVPEADSSLALLDRLVGRTEALEARSSCSEVTSNTVDDLGRLPAEGTCSPQAQVADDPTTTVDESVAPTTTPDGTTPTTTPDSTTTPETSTSDDGGLLPELGSDGLPLPDSEGLSTSGGSGQGDNQVSVPLPLVPPIQLPPLLPGLPGVSIG
ncbi:DUF5667 domain-containing protein [Pseudonocardia abyssalis]|uniref:DUF5667 domain-containing protein n=1 Tax=Pseudonocardia abyssalis TaxID=2792008 RepID=A0ABS6V037_9PSEU|nr:DUF5667 domain-containing protein [Pseudonocardia abyssalis]MBW0117702.1 hypothetical protein [Pseudonocardia abyssalis]MBW0137868.1 hypothetical protein [Pseudonocardia abyssalis]